MILFLDTETNGFPSDGKAANDPTQAQICQLGAILYSEKRRVVAELNVLISRTGWEIKPMLTEIHGIDNALCDQYGVSLATAMSLLAHMWARADLLVCHNVPFDTRMIALAAEVTNLRGYLKELPNFCTMKATTDICQLPKARGAGYKWPKLTEAYMHFFGETLDCAHDAMADVRGCARIYYALQDGRQSTGSRSSVSVEDIPSSGGPI